MIELAGARAWIEDNCALLGAETVPLAAASGRVLATARPALTAAPPVAAIDGFAVQAASTEGASDYAPLPVAAVSIVAGAPMPPGMDAVLPPHGLEAGAALAPAARGDGVALPDALAVAADPLHPLLIAALARRGEATLAVIRRPTVRLRVAPPKAGADALTPMLHALIERAGGQVGDDAPDLVLHTGRSGYGHDDHGVDAFDTVFARGLLVRQVETTTLGAIDARPALLLPGDPLACFIAFALVAAPALRRFGGRPEPASSTATLGRKIVSGLGQIDAIRVRLQGGVALPSGPSLTAEADGLVLVPEGSEGYPEGAVVAISALP